MSKLPTKGYARIYVQEEVHVGAVKDIIKSWDEYESRYMGEHLVSVWDGKVSLVYNGKFDELDLDLLSVECLKRGFQITCFMTPPYSDHDKVWYYEQEINKGLGVVNE